MTQLPYRSMPFYPVVSGGGTFNPSNPTLAAGVSMPAFGVTPEVDQSAGLTPVGRED